MTLEEIKGLCLGLPGATENVQWGADLVFKVGGKMFAVVALAEGSHAMSLKCSPEDFGALLNREGVSPAPYLAKHCWVALQRLDTLPQEELTRLLRDSYALVVATLPKKKRPLP